MTRSPAAARDAGRRGSSRRADPSPVAEAPAKQPRCARGGDQRAAVLALAARPTLPPSSAPAPACRSRCRAPARRAEHAGSAAARRRRTRSRAAGEDHALGLHRARSRRAATSQGWISQ